MGNRSSIAKNTIFLYIRMIIIMLVSLYTTRVVLSFLGEVDYGIYSIVGSVVVSMSFVSHALSSATQRFLSYELGKNNDANVSSVFSMSINIHVILVVFLFLILESVGLWVVNSVLEIPDDRIKAANIGYQFSVITFCINILRTPYNALIISHECMSAFAIFSVLEALFRLIIVFFLSISSCDKLQLYCFLLMIVAIAVNCMYIGFCRMRISNDSRYKWNWDVDLFKKMFSFIKWNLFGGVAGMAANEGPSYFVNIYGGVEANAGFGIAKQVSSAVYSLSNNFQTAFNPRIVKSYAAKDYDLLFRMIHNTSVISFYLMIIFAIPFIFCSDLVLDLWLTDVPIYTSDFCILILISEIVSSLGSPLWMAAHAIGNIKKYQIWISACCLLGLPISCFLLEIGLEPYFVIVGKLVSVLLIFIYRIYYLKKKINFKSWEYIKCISIRCIFPIIICTSILCSLDDLLLISIWGAVLFILISLAIILLLFLFVGIDRIQRENLWKVICKRFAKGYR